MTGPELDAIEARAKEYAPAREGRGAMPITAGLLLDDIPALVAEVRRLERVVEECARIHEIGGERMLKQVNRGDALEAALHAFQRPSGHFSDDCDLREIDAEGPEPFDCGLDFCKAARAALGEA